MTAEQIIKNNYEELMKRQNEIIEICNDPNCMEEDLLLGELVLIQIEIKNRGYALNYQKPNNTSPKKKKNVFLEE